MDHTHRTTTTTITYSTIENEEMVVYERWYEMIPRERISRSNNNHGLLITNLKDYSISLVQLTQSGQIEVSDFVYGVGPHFFWSSCNGFLLESKNNNKQLAITNPATNQHLALPLFIAWTRDHYYCRSAIAYAPTRNEYKVVRTYRSPSRPTTMRRNNCSILTVGVDYSWRFIDTRSLPLSACSRQLSMIPLVTDGFLHWAPDWHTNTCLAFDWFITTHTSRNDVITLNVETEIITRICAPRCNGGYYYYKYFSTGGSDLSLLIGRGYLKWDVWEMKPETGDWTNLPGIDLEAHKDLLNQSYDREEGSLIKPGVGDCLDCKLVPAGWLKYREVIVFVVYRPIKGNGFRQARLRAVYNLQTRGVTLIMLDYSYHPYFVHRKQQRDAN